MIRGRGDLAVAVFQSEGHLRWATERLPKLRVQWFKAMSYRRNDKKANGSPPLGISSASLKKLPGLAIHTAASLGLTQVVQLLLEGGADIEVRTYTVQVGGTPLDTAACYGYTEVVRLLLEKGANIETTRSDTGSIPLDSAACNGHTDVVRLLLDKGANIEATRTDIGVTPLDCAAGNGHADMVVVTCGFQLKRISTCTLGI